MIVLFTVLRLLAILIVSHDMSGLLKTWKSKCWFIAGSLLLSLFVGGITGSLLALLFCYLFLNKISSSEKNSFLFTFLPWVFVEVTSKLLQLYFFPWIFQINLFTGQRHPSTHCFVLSLDLPNFSSDCQSVLY